MVFINNTFGGSFTIFFNDIDVSASSPFLDRCRSYVANSTVYYPVVWGERKPNLTDSIDVTDINFGEDFDAIIANRKGFWISYGYGMLCINMDHFLQLGGFPEYESWGGEDDALMGKVKSKLKFIRLHDKGLMHLFHSNNCSQKTKSTNPRRYNLFKSCLSAQKDLE